MSERNSKKRYDYKLLKQYCEENVVTLKKDYSKENVLRDTIIEAKCLKCDNVCSKGFRQFMNSGCFCDRCTQYNKINKQNQSDWDSNKTRFNNNYLNQFCKDNRVQLIGDYKNVYVNRDTIISAKCLNEACNKNLEKTFRCIVEYGGCYCDSCSGNNCNEKRKTTCLEKYGVEYSLQSEEVREKGKTTCLEKYGVDCNLKNNLQKEKIKETNLIKYGVEYPQQNKEIREKSKASCLEKYGVEHISQSQHFKDKFKATCLEKYGVEHILQSQHFKDKVKATCLEKYGCENPSQNSEVSEKASKNAYKSYDYTFPSGRIERIQGYENYMLNDLLQKENISEDDIIVSRSDVPSVWYEDSNKKKHRYFVDCYIKSQNRCIEAKSTWTAHKKKDCIYLKQNALKDAGYICEIWVYDGKGQIVEKN